MKSKYKIILASNSPRRRELLGGLGIAFEVRVLQGIDESFPQSMPAMDVAQYIAEKKAKAYAPADDELILTADTVVVVDGEILGKPHDEADARRMLTLLSGKTHQVVTGVSMKSTTRHRSFSVVSDVTFKPLCADETDYYVSTFRPFDKAGAYGIQEWIGYIGVTGLQGSYFNVMGLPIQRIYEEMRTNFGLSF